VENRLRSVTGGPSSVTLDYDAFGRLSTVTTGGAATHYRYAGAQLAAESSGGVLLRSHVSGQDVDEQWMSVEGTGAAATPTWYLQDRQSSVIGVSDASGAITPYAYGPYGEPQSWSGSRFRYTGQIAIPEAQLYHYRARAYDPVMGRFLQTDPIGYDDGPNIYAYVKGDPMNRSDPSGTQDEVDEVVVTGTKRTSEKPQFSGDGGGGGWYDAEAAFAGELLRLNPSDRTERNDDKDCTKPLSGSANVGETVSSRRAQVAREVKAALDLAQRDGADMREALLTQISRNVARLAPGGTWIAGGTSQEDGNLLYGAITAELGIPMPIALMVGDIAEIGADLFDRFKGRPSDETSGGDSALAKAQIRDGAKCPAS
jgi:RHS repeat-associated protein